MYGVSLKFNAPNGNSLEMEDRGVMGACNIDSGAPEFQVRPSATDEHLEVLGDYLQDCSSWPGGIWFDRIDPEKAQIMSDGCTVTVKMSIRDEGDVYPLNESLLDEDPDLTLSYTFPVYHKGQSSHPATSTANQDQFESGIYGCISLLHRFDADSMMGGSEQNKRRINIGNQIFNYCNIVFYDFVNERMGIRCFSDMKDM